MKCFKCGLNTKTIYPTIDGQKYVQKMCLSCDWKSYPTPIIRLEALEKRYTGNLEMQARTSKTWSESDE